MNTPKQTNRQTKYKFKDNKFKYIISKIKFKKDLIKFFSGHCTDAYILDSTVILFKMEYKLAQEFYLIFTFFFANERDDKQGRVVRVYFLYILYIIEFKIKIIDN